MLREQVLSLFGRNLRLAIEECKVDFDALQEIRVRAGKPLIFIASGSEKQLQVNVTMRDVKEIVDTACGHSGYAFEEELRRGYLTIEGGHRIGIAGRAVMTAEGIRTIKNISALNIRIAHSVPGCSEPWKTYFYKKKRPCNTLLVSPPGAGKTTLLRDMIRCISDGCAEYAGVSVGVVDERMEIAGSYRGLPSHELGIRTDLLDGCPKSLGMEMLIRSMAPAVVAVDEIGNGDVSSIENALRCGCKVIATMHGECVDDFLKKPGFGNLVREKVFERFIFLKKGEIPGKVQAIYDEEFKVLWREKLCI